MTQYSTTYIDNFGKEESSFISNGNSLKLKLRNNIFEGQNFDSLELQSSEDIANHNFSFNETAFLTNCFFAINFPLIVKRNSEILNAILKVEIKLENSKHPITKDFALTVDNNIY